MSNPKDLRSLAAGARSFFNDTLITTDMAAFQQVWNLLLIKAEMAIAFRAFLIPVFVGNVV